MKYEVKNGKFAGEVVSYNFIENERRLNELNPNNKHEQIIDYLTKHGETPRRVMDTEFDGRFRLRATELNRSMSAMQIIEVDGMVRLQRSIGYSTSKLYQKMYPNSNGRWHAGDDFTAPPSYFEIEQKKKQKTLSQVQEEFIASDIFTKETIEQPHISA